jgi:NAD(P)-dependent dehydrogenase (short-subunit alcohol dehydrogenase family)
MNKKSIMITGANAGIGKATAIALAQDGHKIIMVCRNPERAEKARSDIFHITRNNDVHILLCDLSEQNQIRQMLAQFKNQIGELDILINNAGTTTPAFSLSGDGIERTIAVNHLASFLITRSLLDCFRSNGQIINVSSIALLFHNVEKNDFLSGNHYRMLAAYGKSKLASLMCLYHLSDQIKQSSQYTSVRINAVHPGLIGTDIVGHGGIPLPISNIYKHIAGSPDSGAKWILNLVNNPELSHLSGQFFYKNRPMKTQKNSCDRRRCQEIWKISSELTNLQVYL